MERLRLALLGFGVVGSGVYEMLQIPPYDQLVSVERIFVRHPDKDRGDVPARLFTDRIDDIFASGRVDVIVEAMGGVDPARAMITRALKERIHVITANKEVVDHDFYAFVSLAQKQGVAFLFEASVVAGVPVISSLVELVDSDRIKLIEGILNGATNDVLTRVRAGSTFSEAIQRAREQGFLEADPRDDLAGFDALRKIMIMARIASQREIDRTSVERIALSEATPRTIAFLRSRNWCLKQVARALFAEDRASISVEPMVLEDASLLGSVEHENNAVIIETEKRGRLVMIGKGAGKRTTAAAMVNDLMLIARNRYYVIENRRQDAPLKNRASPMSASYLLEVDDVDASSSIARAIHGHFIITKPIVREVLDKHEHNIIFQTRIYKKKKVRP
ncbi:MAG: homoserine dehydrogenase [Acholeplasmataceae bacterium]